MVNCIPRFIRAAASWFPNRSAATHFLTNRGRDARNALNTMRTLQAVAAGLAGLLSAHLPARAQTPPPTFDGARWIWFSREPMPITTAQSFPGGANYFRAAVTAPAPARIASAEIIVTADNLFSLFLNGQLVGESAADNSAWGQPKRFDVAHLGATSSRSRRSTRCPDRRD